MHRRFGIVFGCLLIGLLWLGPSVGGGHPQATPSVQVDPAFYKALQWRSIGPHRGGRVVAVAGHPTDPLTFYFGGTGGGVWRTTDGGLTWENISDGFFKTGSVGAIAVSEADPNVIYVGMGESCWRGNISPGDGVYKSTDGGKTWKHMGLAETQFIARIRIHPKNPDLVYVAAMGHAFGPNPERGVYRSRDGGKTWEKVLYKSDKAGAVDLAMDPNNPRILYAALYEARRYPWGFVSGGPDSGIYKTTDGGDTWTDITNNPGLPKGLKGRIGITVSPARPDRVWAIIEAEGDGKGLYRSDDGGATWQKVNGDPELVQRPWYYMHVVADPQDPETVYVLNVQFWKSTDGGRTFTRIPTPHGDNHDLWIDPRNPKRMIEGNDGGATVTFDGGASWSSLLTQPTAQFYHVTVDRRFPYRVYGAQQDNTTLSVPSRSDYGAITQAEWYPVGGCESGYIAVRPDDPDIVFAGCYGGQLTRYDHRTRQTQDISVWPDNPMGWGAKDLKYRFQWTFPILISPHDPNVLYVAGNHVFRSTDEGRSWEVISPDLTRNDKSKMEPSGGPITKDNTSVEYYGTVFALAESYVQKGVLWAGSDDGLVHVSRDGGKTWENVTPKDLPEWSRISIIEPSHFDAGTAYLAANRYQLDDFRPYLYKTTDFGKTWKRITRGIPPNAYTRVIREDPVRRGLLYAGTEFGVFVSFDDGETWQSLQLNLPVVPIHDMVVQDDDLVVATHGRSFWILDDLTVLRQITPDALRTAVYLFQPAPTVRFRGGFARNVPNAGQNPPNGVVVYYYLREKPKGEIRLEFLDASGRVIRTFSSQAPAEGEEEREPRLPAEAGLNRFVWNLRYPGPQRVRGLVLWGGWPEGPLALPGTYRVRLTVDGQAYEQSFEVLRDPRVSTPPEALARQFELLLQIRDKVSEVHRAILTIREVRQQVESAVRRAAGQSYAETLRKTAQSLLDKLTAIEEGLVQTRSKAPQDPLNYPIHLNNKLTLLMRVVDSADAAPTRQAYEVFEELRRRADIELTRLREVLEKDVGAFNQMVRDLNVPAVVVPRERP
jgi:photosystem II stability/assembly factor-like uncharacterized protein